ncbi:MAG: hypothetical protein UH854_00060 [Clostridia bacterium]|nr:hypothetical protein [Clostridia bacterium]
MVYKRYNSPFEDEKQHSPQCINEEPICEPQREHPQKCDKSQSPVSMGFLDNLAYDDIIIISLIIILLGEDKHKRDVPLILTLAFLFLIQYIDAD